MRCSLYFPHCRLDFGYARRVVIHTQIIMLVHSSCRARPISGPIDSRDVIYLISPSFTSSPHNPLCDRRRAGPELSPSHTDDCETFIVMCGIIAVFESQPTSSCKQDELSSRIQDSLGYIAHRGPDASAVWVNEDATCGKPLFTEANIANHQVSDTADLRSTISRQTGNNLYIPQTGSFTQSSTERSTTTTPSGLRSPQYHHTPLKVTPTLSWW
jgi:hypothetical protein